MNDPRRYEAFEGSEFVPLDDAELAQNRAWVVSAVESLLAGVESERDLGRKLYAGLGQMERVLHELMAGKPVERENTLRFSLAMVACSTIAKTLQSSPIYGPNTLEHQIKYQLRQVVAAMGGVGKPKDG